MSGTGNILVVSALPWQKKNVGSNPAGTIFITCLASLRHARTSVDKRYKPDTLRIIYLINLFFCEILCPERQNYLKKIDTDGWPRQSWPRRGRHSEVQ